MKQNPPADIDDIALQGRDRGTNQSGMRAHNERLVLSLVRRHGALAKADIARLTGLSAQTVSVIMRALETDGLLVKGDPVRGKVGQPSVPMMLAPTGAYFYGLKLGRRSAALIFIDFLGQVVARRRITYRYPMPDTIVGFVTGAVAELTGSLPEADRGRVAGLGIAMPFLIWDWADSIGLEPGAMDVWRTRDIATELGAALDLPVFLQNDATAACGAELVFGDTASRGDVLYFYVGYFIGGGIILNGTVFAGRSGNAGAIGSLQVPGAAGSRQLIDIASLRELETAFESRGGDGESLWQDAESWDVPEDLVAEWIGTASEGLAFAIVSACAIIDFETVMIDGWMPAAMRERLVEGTRRALGQINVAGLQPPEVIEGTIGPEARSLGAASMPLSERFLADGRAVVKQN